MFEFINDEDRRGQVGIGTLIVFIAMVLVAAIAAGVLINTAGFLQTQAEETGQDSTDQVANNINVIGTVGDTTDPDAVSGDDYSGNKIYSGSENPDVYQVKLTVQKSPGAGDVDLSGLSIQYVGPDTFANLVHASEQLDSGSIPSGGFSDAYLVDEITAESPSDTVMTSSSDRYEVIIPVGVYWDVSADSNGRLLDSGGGQLVALEQYTTDTDAKVDLTSTGNDADLDNTKLDLLEEGESTELTITTESGSQRYVTLKVPDSLVGDDGGTVQL